MLTLKLNLHVLGACWSQAHAFRQPPSCP